MNKPKGFFNTIAFVFHLDSRQANLAAIRRYELELEQEAKGDYQKNTVDKAKTNRFGHKTFNSIDDSF